MATVSELQRQNAELAQVITTEVRRDPHTAVANKKTVLPPITWQWSATTGTKSAGSWKMGSQTRGNGIVDRRRDSRRVAAVPPCLEVPQIDCAGSIAGIGIPSPPAGFDGIARFRFLNQFTYGNFGDQGSFGLEL
jgi:hypothetical protein